MVCLPLGRVETGSAQIDTCVSKRRASPEIYRATGPRASIFKCLECMLGQAMERFIWRLMQESSRMRFKNA